MTEHETHPQQWLLDLAHERMLDSIKVSLTTQISETDLQSPLAGGFLDESQYGRVGEIHLATAVQGRRDRILCWLSDHAVAEFLLALFGVALFALTLVVLL